jgi:hypothetical protein
MPIVIYNNDVNRSDYVMPSEKGGEINRVCNLSENIWDLPTQIDDLEKWLKDEGKDLKPSKYVADIGFDIRPDACGGGVVLSSEAMKILGNIGMDVYFSEYPNTIDKD